MKTTKLPRPFDQADAAFPPERLSVFYSKAICKTPKCCQIISNGLWDARSMSNTKIMLDDICLPASEPNATIGQE